MAWLLCLGLLWGAGTVHAADEEALLLQENRLLRAELELARQPQLYLVFDLPERQVAIKSMGMVARSLPVDEVRVWGEVAAATVRRLLGKDSVQVPQREILHALPLDGGDQAAADEYRALELAEMPERYRLRLDDGTLIWVRPPTGGFLQSDPAGGIRHCWERPHFPLPGQEVGPEAPCAEIFLTMPSAEARRLYWSFSEGLSCLIRYPIR